MGISLTLGKWCFAGSPGARVVFHSFDFALIEILDLYTSIQG